jgi:hypothetical protein
MVGNRGIESIYSALIVLSWLEIASEGYDVTSAVFENTSRSHRDYFMHRANQDSNMTA